MGFGNQGLGADSPCILAGFLMYLKWGVNAFSGFSSPPDVDVLNALVHVMSRSTVKSQKGFTIIELIVVIVILGVLAATALPKFISLSGTASIAVIDGLRGNVASAMNMAYVKCLTFTSCGIGQPVSITVDGKAHAFYNGYPNAGETVSTGIDAWVNIQGVTAVGVSMYNTRFQVDRAKNPSACYVDYREAVSFGTTPIITTNTTGC
ncbi:MAG: prepilin-type N-terminal cleavage/methylation domain-containing protein [Aquabacterium sp.]|nr:prepilin-type N-terminal cleavage/methylation domain-containing protein [Aquabacterium sp.]